MSASVHAAVLHLSIRGTPPSTASEPVSGRSVSALELLQIRTPPDVVYGAAEPASRDPDRSEPPILEPVETDEDRIPRRGGSLTAFDPSESDSRLWDRPTVEATPTLKSTRPAEAISDSAVYQWNNSGMRIGPVRIGLKTCDSYLTCRLDFVQGSRLGETFQRMREIEGQAVLSALYRKRLEAMKVRRRHRKSN